MKRLQLATLLALLAGPLQAQTYLLMAVSGDVQYSSNGTWKKAATGARLTGADQLRVGDKGYAAVVFNNARTFELKKPGSYPMQQLSAGARTASSSVTSRYLDYVVNRSTSNKLGNNMSNLGAVERSMAPVQVGPRQGMIADAKAGTFRWQKQPGTQRYILTLSDEDGNELLKEEVTDTVATLDLTKLNLKPGTNYYWKVANARLTGMPSDELWFQVLSAEKEAEIKTAEVELATASEEKSAVSYIVLAQFYQENKLNEKAQAAYEEGIRLAPDVREYKLMYAEFLNGIGLSGQAYEIVKNLPKE